MRGILTFLSFLLLLWLGRSILIPLLIAGFLWYLLNAITDYYRRALPNNGISKFWSRVFDWVANLSSFATLILTTYLFATQIRPMFSELVAALPALQSKLITLGEYLSESLDIKFDASMLPNITQMASNIGASIAGIATSMGMVLIYLIFMFVEQSTFNQKFSALFNSKKQYKKSQVKNL